MFDIWLEHFGIFDEVKKLYKEKKNKRKEKANKTKNTSKKTETKDNKLDKIICDLTDKEKEELLKLLQK